MAGGGVGVHNGNRTVPSRVQYNRCRAKAMITAVCARLKRKRMSAYTLFLLLLAVTDISAKVVSASDFRRPRAFFRFPAAHVNTKWPPRRARSTVIINSRSDGRRGPTSGGGRKDEEDIDIFFPRNNYFVFIRGKRGRIEG